MYGYIEQYLSSSLVVCEVDESLKAKLSKFRFRKETNNAAILSKYQKPTMNVIVPFISPFCTFIVYSYKYVHADGRVSYPLCFIFSSPMGCKPEQQMMYAGSKNQLVQAAELTKVFETRNADDLTEEWLKNQLAFFR
uniref:Glia maturation factor n=1 Tax=Sander lucioperca TaxID=283035 RepID=A0A8D0ATZ7_SANLU